MSENLESRKYERRVSPLERLFSRSPFSIVTVVARIKGRVTETMLANAVAEVRQRHPNLRVRIREDADRVPWFTSEGAKGIPIEVVPRASDDHWIKVIEEQSRIPFEFDVRPAIRFILVQSPAESELVILCHHILCDGMSLAYLARDLMLHLGDPGRKVEVLADPAPIDMGNMPEGVALNGIARFFVARLNKKWEADKTFFDQEDYVTLSEAYWANYRHRTLSVELSEAQTLALVQRCRSEGVTVNSALTAAFVGAQCAVQGEEPYHSSIGVAGSLRDRLRTPAGEVMGFYAGLVSIKWKYKARVSFWENARRFHGKLKPLLTNKRLFGAMASWCYLEPAILEALNVKRLGGLFPPSAASYDKLAAFAQRDDVVSSLLRRGKMDSLDRVVMGTAVTNLTRMDFPRQYAALELDRLIMHPGGGFPLVTVNLVLGAVTCAGKLSLVLEYAEERVDSGTMARIRDQAMGFLLEG